MKMEKIHYDDRIVRDFIWATILFGVVGMLVGVIIAVQLFWPAANLNLPWTSFGRLRPLHTNAVIFAFCGNAIFAGIYYSSQRLLKARLASDFLSRFHFWGWQAIIVAAAITLPLGLSTSKEYAELEWPIDIAIALVWVAFGVNLIWTTIKRREPTLYVSIWFYIATFLAVAMLHIVNSLNIPVSLFKSYPIFKGVQDALVQWWYGHNAVAFFLTTPFLGLAYYFIPKSVEKPIYSYRLSIIHFWSLIFVYIWAGPHHLQYTSLPEWLQSLGMVFSVMLLAPSWGGAINFVLTLRNGWERVRIDPIPKFFAAATTFYMMATFEGPLLSIKSVNAISHNTDWTVGHVHSGALGWNGLLIFGMIYWLVPRLYKTKLYSEKLANVHFWIATAGIAIYIISMWISGVMQGLMSSAVNDAGLLAYPNYLEIVTAVIPLHVIRATGGALYLGGLLLLAWNVWQTVSRSHQGVVDTVVEVPAIRSAESLKVDYPAGASGLLRIQTFLENRAFLLAGLSLVAVSIGGLVQIIPIVTEIPGNIAMSNVTPWTGLEIEGRDIYIREGCNNCHTQQIRPIIGETMRYGPYSRAGEFVYDTPHLWGSKRTGPDLARIGGKYGDLWHWKHTVEPRLISSGSIMPNYPWLKTGKIQFDEIPSKLKALQLIGIPYSDEQIQSSPSDAQQQAQLIGKGLRDQGEVVSDDQELIALVAYLQRLGVDGRNWEKLGK
ncbi:MAG: cytochrome-c oxidase, cbb3-type subunit I [Proteobacteria bacterium]|nr:cytochrome-c oxidase, cbb3-type subunit I [Pseudomonadota bacterium]